MHTYTFWALKHEETGFYLCRQEILDHRHGWGRHQLVLSTYGNAMRFKSESDAWRFLAEEKDRQFLGGLTVSEVIYHES